jgi:hypothetical protein
MQMLPEVNLECPESRKECNVCGMNTLHLQL